MARKYKSEIRRAEPSRENSILKETLYRKAFAVLKEYLDDNNWLSAIVIEESIISDRIESSMSKKGVDNRILTLRDNLHNFRDYADKSDPAYEEILTSLNTWITERNFAVHMIVKNHEGENLTWDQRLERIRETAINGAVLARTINNWGKRKLNR